MATTEAERLRLNRQYFEEGCLCILEAKTISPCKPDTPDEEAVAFYESNCTCSRTYIPKRTGRGPN